MFEKALSENREAIYAILAPASLPPGAATPSGGTAFMIAPGLLVTAARCVPGGSDPGTVPCPELSLIRAPDIGRGTERATLVSLDRGKGLALLRIDAPRSAAFLRTARRPRPDRHAMRVFRFSAACDGSRSPARRLSHRDVPGSERLFLRENGRPGR